MKRKKGGIRIREDIPERRELLVYTLGGIRRQTLDEDLGLDRVVDVMRDDEVRRHGEDVAAP